MTTIQDKMKATTEIGNATHRTEMETNGTEPAVFKEGRKATTVVKNTITRTPTTVVSTTETRVSKSGKELSQSKEELFDDDTVIQGVVCRRCGLTLPDHTVGEHLDISCSVHSCEGGHKNEEEEEGRCCSAADCNGGRAYDLKGELFCSPACGNKHFNLKEGDDDFWEEEEGLCDGCGAKAEEEKITKIEEKISKIDEFYAPKEGMGNCCLCKGLMSNKWGNNPAPLKKRGKCCDKCNADKVIPARMGGVLNVGTHEEQILQRKLFLLMGECMWENDHEPFNKIKREWLDLVIARGMFPNVDWKKKSISFTPIAEMMKDEWDKQNPVW